jgi:hypothetical protein
VSKPTSQIAIIEAQRAAEIAAMQAATANRLKPRIAAARATVGTWEGAKAYLIGTFKERWEAALRRAASVGMTTVDAVRQAVLDVLNVKMDDKMCEIISGTPAFLGAVTTHSDIKIISDLLDVIDKTPELAYMKEPLIKIAVRYAVKNILDDVVVRTQSSDIATVKAAMLECGLTQWQIDKSQFSGGQIQIWYSTTNQMGTFGFRDFDIYMLAGVDWQTLEDLR